MKPHSSRISRFSRLSLVLLVLSTVASTPVLAGGSGTSVGGGGSTIQISPKKAMLLDLYLSNPKVDLETPVGAALEVTPFLKNAHFDLINLTETPAFRIAFERLGLWKSVTPRLVNLIAGTLHGQIRFYYTFRKFKKYPNFYLPTSLPARNEKARRIETAILFDSLFGPFVNATAWNLLSDFSRAGLLIHEALRHVQFIAPGVSTDRSIQEITAQIMLNSPNQNADLESEKYLGKNLISTMKTLDLSQYVPQEFAAAVEMRLFFIHAAQVMTEIQAAVAKNERARTWYNQNLKGLESCTPYFHLVTPQVTEEEIGCRAVLANMSDTLEVLGQGTQNPNPFPLLIQQLSLKEEYIDWADHAEGPNSSLGSWDQGQLFYSALLKVADPESSDDTPFMGRLYFMAAPWVIRNYLDGSLSPSEASIISRATDVYSAGRLPESARTLGDWMEMYFKKKLDP